ncbi:MAG: hypothetical protein Q8M23_00140, partial [Bacteroidales bacterium]|nr:hypothetical protein [Bacteroidales bacterium]
MKTFKIQILAILALLVLFSCKKELANSFANEQENIKNTNDGVKNAIMLKKDIIALNDVDEFHELYSFILKNQDDEMFLFTYIKDKYGITSMREIYEYGMKTEDHNTFNEYVTRYPKVFVSEYFDNSYIYNFPGSNILSYMVNSEGLIVVGDSIYEVDIKGTYINAVEKIILENGDKSFVKTEQGRFL